MNKIFIVLLFILLGSSLIVVNNIKGTTENSFNVVYENNKNIALPDLTNKTEIIDGLYRLNDNNGITIDFNVYNGNYIINGTKTSNFSYIFTDYIPIGTYTMSYHYVSGSTVSNTLYLGNSGAWNINININTSNYMQSMKRTNTQNNQTRLYLDFAETTSFNNYTFKIQFEKGSTATPYVVPKLVPMYQDNLTMEEKQQIGFGAFGGVTQIIKTINDIIKPVGDFINGILSWF